MRRLAETEVATWVQDTLLSPSRTRPIVAVTSHPGTDRAWVDPADLQRALGDLAEVVFLVTGEPTWALTESLPPRLDAYGGALRIWWPLLTRESDPYAHRLYFVRSPVEAARVFHQIVAAVRGRAGLPAAIVPAAAPAPPTGPAAPMSVRPIAPAEPPERVRVTAVSPGHIEVAAGTRHGPVLEADLPLGMLEDAVRVGCEFEARPLRLLDNGTTAFATTVLSPGLWQRFAAEVRAGDVVVGRVQNLNERAHLVFVDVLPGVVGVCHISELDYGFVADLAAFARPGELLTFEVLRVDTAAWTLQLSRKRAYGQDARPLPSLVEGGHPFVWKEGMPLFENLRQMQRRVGSGDAEPRLRIVGPRAPTGTPALTDAEDEIEALQAELAAANDERSNLVAQIRALRLQVQAAKKELRAAEDRHAASERRGSGDDPLASERAFLLAVRTWYAREFDEDDRLQRPLRRMRVGREFLASVRATDGIEIDKVIEVCAQVAADIAHTIPGRDSHQLRAGSRGADARTRKRDGAQAWRCALQVKTPSARRLHWWNVPGKDGGVIEFACIVLHDSFDIPEA